MVELMVWMLGLGFYLGLWVQGFGFSALMTMVAVFGVVKVVLSVRSIVKEAKEFYV